MVLNTDNTDNNILSRNHKTITPDFSPIMSALVEQDTRLYFAFCITRHEFLYTNVAFKNFFGSKVNQLPTQYKNYLQPEDYKYLKNCVAEMKAGIVKKDMEIGLNFPDKNPCRLKLNLIYNTDSNGYSALSGYAEVITIKQLCHTFSEEEDHHRKYKLLNTLSHDLLSPMGSIHNLAALLSRKSALQQDPEVNKWVSLIEVISKKSIGMIRGFVKKEFAEPEISAVKNEFL